MPIAMKNIHLTKWSNFRFGRDYYINEAKFPKGHSVGDNGFYTATSRPNSSLSQHSLSTGSDYEQQVSQGLDRFEEASLWGSLSRRSYRGPEASPHFVTNPLVHLVVTDRNDEKSDDPLDRDSRSSREGQSRLDIVEEKNRTDLGESVNNATDSEICTNTCTKSAGRESSPVRDSKNVIDHPIEAKDLFAEDINEKATINPLYDREAEILRFSRGLSPVDRDSGMYSIESVDLENCNLEKSNLTCHEKSADTTTRLRYPGEGDEVGDNRGWIGNDRKYWTLESKKFQTFGGIKRRKRWSWIDQGDEDSDDDDVTVVRDREDFQNSSDADFFAGRKFQTFGGIKNNGRSSEHGNPKNRRQRARRSTKTSDESQTFENKILSGIFSKSRNRPIVAKKSFQPPIDVAKKITHSNIDIDSPTIDDSQSVKLERPRVPEVVHRSFESLLDLRQGRDSKIKRSVRSREERRDRASTKSSNRN